MTLKVVKKQKYNDGLERDMQETWAIHGVYPTIAWTPDSKSLVFWDDGKINRLQLDDKLTDSKSRVIDFHVKTTKKIQQALSFEQHIEQDNFAIKMLRDVKISPNGKKVVFESMGYIYTQSIANGKAKGKAKRLNQTNFS